MASWISMDMHGYPWIPDAAIEQVCRAHRTKQNQALSDTACLANYDCISFDSGASRPFPAHSQTMKMLSTLCISYDSTANRPPPGTSKTKKMMTVQCFSYENSRPTAQIIDFLVIYIVFRACEVMEAAAPPPKSLKSGEGGMDVLISSKYS